MPKKICSTKTCPHNGEPQDTSEFYKDKRAKDGLESRCKTCIKVKSKKAYDDAPDKAKERHKRWRDERGGKQKMNEYQNAYRKKRFEEHPELRLKKNVSFLIYDALVIRQGLSKGGSTFEHLPYTPLQLKEHIESQFTEGMTWENYGDWNVDHIIPQAALPYKSLKEENFQKCWALKNLRPLWAKENQSKGSYYEGKRHTYNTRLVKTCQ